MEIKNQSVVKTPGNIDRVSERISPEIDKLRGIPSEADVARKWKTIAKERSIHEQIAAHNRKVVGEDKEAPAAEVHPAVMVGATNGRTRQSVRR
jgi:hypothetical protein